LLWTIIQLQERDLDSVFIILLIKNHLGIWLYRFITYTCHVLPIIFFQNVFNCGHYNKSTFLPRIKEEI